MRVLLFLIAKLRLCDSFQTHPYANRGFRRQNVVSRFILSAQDGKGEISNLLLDPDMVAQDEVATQLLDEEAAPEKKDFQTGSLFTSVVLLNFVAVIWGTQHAVIKQVISDTPPSSYSLLRFGLAAIIASPYTPGIQNLIKNNRATSPHDIRKAWRWGLEMGIWMFLGFALQAIGLESTTATRSGFLLYLNVKFVPLFAFLTMGREISLATWVSAFTAFFGTVLLATGDLSLGFNVGDVWSIAAAAASAMFILRLEKASAEVEESSQLNAASLWVVFLLSVIWSHQNHLSFGNLGEIAMSHPIEIIYLGGVTTALSNYIQTLAQKDISAERASIIYSLDPVYGAFFSWLLLNETLGGVQSYIGALLIALAAGANAFLDFGVEKEKSLQEGSK